MYDKNRNVVMGILDLFKTNDKSKQEKFGHLKVLLALALADGQVGDAEANVIAVICQREGISDSDVKRCINNPDAVKSRLPKDHETKVKYLKDMILLMICDGDINKDELVLCKAMAQTLGLSKETIDELFLDFIKEAKDKLKYYNHLF